MPFLTQGKTNWKYILIVLILAVIVGGGILYCYLNFPEAKFTPINFPPKPERYSCNVDADCGIRRVDCSGCDFNLACINEKWGHCELSPPPGESCLPPVPASWWPRSCECIDSKCVTKEVIGETADWKTYRNEEYGFEVKYLKDWEVRTEDSSYWCQEHPEYDCLMYVQFFPPSTRETSWINLVVYGNIWRGEGEEIKTNGCKATYNYLSNRDYLFTISTCVGLGQERTEEIYNQMLSTFRFLE